MILLAPAAALAQVSIPANVESVSSGGYWERNGKAGRYRVVVVNSGFETVTSRLFVQWIGEPQGAEAEQQVIASVEPKLPFGQDVASFSVKLTPLGKNQMRITVEGVLSREPNKKISASLVASKPGEVAP